MHNPLVHEFQDGGVVGVGGVGVAPPHAECLGNRYVTILFAICSLGLCDVKLLTTNFIPYKSSTNK